MERQTFDMTDLARIGKELEAAPPAPARFSKQQLLRELEPTLEKLRDEKGYTLEALVALLKDRGLDVKVSTLQSAFKRKGKKKAKAAQPAPPPSPPPENNVRAGAKFKAA